MCIVSMIGDDWRKRLSDDYPWVGPYIKPAERITWPPQRVSSEEIEKLRKEIESLKKLLKAAKIYDEETDQPDCEVDEKVELIRRMAGLLDVDLEDLF